MKKRFSLTRMLHNDKLMMLISAILAVLVWALVVYGPSNTEEQIISGVPIAVTLNDYATQTLKLRINEGEPPTATVKVRGLRSVVSRLSAADITVTADTGNVIKEGTYILPLRAESNGDYTIQSVVGPDGSNETVTISCDVWREAYFPVLVEMPRLKVTDETMYQIGTPVLSNTVLRDGALTLFGPRSDINRVHTVAAVINDEASLNESGVFTATLEARDINGKSVDTVSFTDAKDRKVSVTVPVLVYREVVLTPVRLNVPAGYQTKSNLVTVTPSKLALWGVPTELEDYINSIQEELVVDFDHLDKDSLTKEIYLEPRDAVRPVDGNETLLMRVNLTGISKRTFDLTVDASNFTANNLPPDMAVTVKQTKLTVTLCGPSQVINRIKTSDIRVNADLAQSSTGLQTVQARVSVVGTDTVWAQYMDGMSGLELLVSVDK